MTAPQSEVRYGNTVPRIFTAPLATGPPGPCGCGCALTPETSAGFDAVEFAEDPIGMRLHPWQRWLLIHALELRPDGIFRFRKILILVARQNGKTSVVEIKNLWKLFVRGVPLVVGTAQNLDVAEESWDKAIEIIEGTPELAAELDSVIKVNGKKSFKLLSGGRWKVQAANRRGARGLSADDVNLDELREHQKWDAWGAVTKTTNARAEAQVWSFSNAGDDASVVLNDQQAKGRAAARNPETADPATGFFEWSAPDDTRCTCNRAGEDPHEAWCKLLDRAVQAMANPSAGYPGGILWDALRSDAQTDSEGVFLTECLCVRVADLSGRSIDIGRWRALADEHSRRDGGVALAVDIAPDRSWSAIGIYAHRADGTGHVQMLDYLEGTAVLMDRLNAWRADLNPLVVAMMGGTWESMKLLMRDAGVQLPSDRKEDGDPDAVRPRMGDALVVKGAESAAACAQMIDAVRQGTLRHKPSKHMDAAVMTAVTRKSGQGAVAWAPRNPDSPILGLTVPTVARYAFYERMALLSTEDYDPADDFF